MHAKNTKREGSMMHGEDDRNDPTAMEFPFQLRRIGTPATCKGVKDIYRLDKAKTVIGRHLAVVDIYLNSGINKQLISRQHAELCMECSQNSWAFNLQDKSTNGTFVNDVKICGKVKLREGDTLTFGHTQGIRIQPGMHRIQPYSEFRFVLERVQSENLPPNYSSPSRQFHSTSPTSESRLGIQNLDQTPEFLSKSSLPRLTVNTSPILSPIRRLVPTEQSNGHENNYHDKYRTDRSEATYKNERHSESACSEHKQELPSTKDGDYRVCTWNTISVHGGESTVHQNQQDCSPSVTQTQHEKSTSIRPQERTRAFSDTDNDLLELTSIISAKAADFGASDSSDLDFRKVSTTEETTPAGPNLQTSPQADKSSAPCPVQHDDTPGSSATNQKPSTEQTPTENDKNNKRGNTTSSKKKKKRKRMYAKPNKPKASEVAPDFTSTEECDSFDCHHPLDTTVDWVQCDGCDKWYHVACVGCDFDTVREDSAAFHCGCT